MIPVVAAPPLLVLAMIYTIQSTKINQYHRKRQEVYVNIAVVGMLAEEDGDTWPYMYNIRLKVYLYELHVYL